MIRRLGKKMQYYLKVTVFMRFLSTPDIRNSEEGAIEFTCSGIDTPGDSLTGK